ncbi:MAG: hypothetical protein K0R18_891 [Bacillales bacterium]|jgi:hypothetical protein|nr:hypothetical protein [Bacillales bacterium]
MLEKFEKGDLNFSSFRFFLIVYFITPSVTQLGLGVYQIPLDVIVKVA